MSKESNAPKLVKNIIYKYRIKIETGLHIGGTKELVKIGGVDSPVIRGYKVYEKIQKTPIRVPIIPGSSIKGKMRALLDIKYNHIASDEKRKGQTKECETSSECTHGICILFGRSSDKATDFNRGRLIVRDAYPTEDTVKQWETQEDVIEGGEIKGENTIDRITSKANPRFIERVPAGSVFETEFVLSIYENDDENKLTALLQEGIALLQDNYLGGSGSRGYGKVKFEQIEKIEKNAEDYLKGESNE